MRHLADKYAAILDGLMRDGVTPQDVRVAKMEGVEASYEAVQARQRVRGFKSRSIRGGRRMRRRQRQRRRRDLQSCGRSVQRLSQNEAAAKLSLLLQMRRCCECDAIGMTADVGL